MLDMTRLRCSVLLTCIISIAVRTVQDDNQQWGIVMLSRGDVATIRAEIERLEKALMRECTDGRIRDRIKTWIEEGKKKLIAGGEASR